MARFAVFSIAGDGMPLAWRLHQEGHQVALWCRTPAAKRIGQGLVDCLPTPDPSRGTICVFDGTGMVELADRFRRRGLPVLGGAPLERWETTRRVGVEVMARGGLSVPETHTFHRLADVHRFLGNADPEATWYVKPDGDVPKSMTRKGTPPMLQRFLTWAEPQLTQAKVPRIDLQAPAPPGVEVDVAAWLDGRSVVATEVTIEEKKFCAGNVGPATGCQSNLVYDVPPSASLVLETLGPFLDEMLEHRTTGMVSINTIITPDHHVYGLEFTFRFGWDATQASMALFADDFGDQLADLATGQLSDFTRNKRDAALALRLSTPPQPLDDSKDDRRLAGLPLDPTLLEDPAFYPDDVARREGLPIMATGSGHIGVVTAVGNDLADLRRRVLEHAERLDIPDVMYRIDPVSRAETDLAALAALDGQASRPLESLSRAPHDRRPRFGRDDRPSTGQRGEDTQSITPSPAGMGSPAT